MSSEPILITRYPNRRFYARHESRYVSLQEIEALVRDGRQVEIHDSQTDEDLTAGVLTRIIIEQQPEKMRLFPIEMLHSILRSNEVTTDFLRDYFRHALPYLEYLKRHSAAAMNLIQPMHWLKAWMDGMTPRKPGDSEAGKPAEPPPLTERIAELEERIRQLETSTAQRES
jgi:polyhydroxyalkanoate synthesis repressor PhaR